MENEIIIKNTRYEMRYCEKSINFSNAKSQEKDGWKIPSFEQWDAIRHRYCFQRGNFFVDGNTIALPHTGLTSNMGNKYYDYWCDGGTEAFNPFCCGGTTFSRMEPEWHASLVLIKEIENEITIKADKETSKAILESLKFMYVNAKSKKSATCYYDAFINVKQQIEKQ